MSEPIPFYWIWIFAFFGSAALLGILMVLWAVGKHITNRPDESQGGNQ